MSRRILSLSLSINGVSYLITEGISDGRTWSNKFISFSVGILRKDTSRHCRCLLNPLWLLFYSMKRNRRLTVSIITSVLMLLPVFTSTPLQLPTTPHFHPQSLPHRSTESLLSIKEPDIYWQTDCWMNMECEGGKLCEKVYCQLI